MGNEGREWLHRSFFNSPYILALDIVRVAGKPTQGLSPALIHSKAVDSTCSGDKHLKAASQRLSIDQASHQFKTTVKTFVVS